MDKIMSQKTTNYFQIVVDNKDKFHSDEFIKHCEHISYLYGRYDDWDEKRRNSELNEYLAMFYADMPVLSMYDIKQLMLVCPVLMGVAFIGVQAAYTHYQTCRMNALNRDWVPVDKK